MFLVYTFICIYIYIYIHSINMPYEYVNYEQFEPSQICKYKTENTETKNSWYNCLIKSLSKTGKRSGAWCYKQNYESY